MLWYVFKPGTDVYIQKHTKSYAAVVRNVSNEHGSHYYSEHPSGLEYCNLQVWYLDSDCSKFGRVTIRQRIQAYSGLREVTSLDVCPASIWDAFDKGERRKAIMKRSKLLLKALQQEFLLVDYDGPVSSQRQAGKEVVGVSYR